MGKEGWEGRGRERVGQIGSQRGSKSVREMGRWRERETKGGREGETGEGRGAGWTGLNRFSTKLKRAKISPGIVLLTN